ncbi:MAG TPA: sialidase family protein [Anaerolineales bacterium]
MVRQSWTRPFRRLALLLFILVLALSAINLSVKAGTFTVAPLTLITGPSPFAACADGATGTPGETLYVNAEVEPWVDVNPANPNNILAVWQQDRWSNGGAHGLVTGVSHNGGKTWSRTFAHFSTCAGGNTANGGNYARASDPWVTFAPNGDAYQISLSVDANAIKSAILVSKSMDGGDTWSEPTTLILDSGLRDSSWAFNDKESITADPTNANYVYAVWDRFTSPAGTSKASFLGLLDSRAFRQPVWFSRTTDGGQTWEPARNIYDRSSQNGTIGNQIVVLPNGDLVDIFDEFFVHKNSNDQRGESISIIRSTDKGVTWSKTSIVVAASLEIGAFDPDTGRPIRAEGGIPDIAVNRTNGTLYAVWQDTRFSGVDEIALSMSTDGGFTWSSPVKVNQTPRSATTANQQAFLPAVHVADDGTVAVSYYDFRANDASPGVPTDYWIVHCHPSGTATCANTADWGDEARLSPSSFDIEQAPAARGPFGYFLGDYEGLANIGNNFTPVFIQVNNGNPANRTDGYFTTVGP